MGICAVDKEVDPDFDPISLKAMGLDTVYNDLCSEIISRKKKHIKLESEYKGNVLKFEGLKVENGKMREMLVRCRRDLATFREHEHSKEQEFDSLRSQYQRGVLETKQKIDALNNELDMERTK